MSADSSLDVQTGLLSKLSGASALTGLLAAGAGGIYDHVPAGSAYPYVVIGMAVSRPLDTQGTTACDVTATIDVYSRAPDFKNLKAIAVAIYDTLHRQIYNIPNQTLVLSRWIESDMRLEESGKVRRASLRYQIITDPL